MSVPGQAGMRADGRPESKATSVENSLAVVSNALDFLTSPPRRRRR
jgi:hypothetical protein